MKDFFRPTVARINLESLQHNCRVLRTLQSRQDRFFCPMVKADAYGHGDLQVTRAILAEGVTHVGVATVEEGLRLRENLGLGFGVLVFAPIRDKGAHAAIEAELTPVFSSWAEIEAFEKNLYSKAHFRVHVKFNTGMSRLGFAPSEAENIARYFRDNDRFSVEGVCTHLAEGEDAFIEKLKSAQQLQKFFMAARAFSATGSDGKVHLHALNSAALISAHCGEIKNHLEFGARPGIALYGSKPELALGAPEPVIERWNQVELKPVLSLVTQIAHVQKLEAGDAVSYGSRWTSPGSSVVAVIPVGYADGLNRSLSNKGRMLIRGEEVPIVGTVCMDYTMVDVTSFGEAAAIGNENVVIIGRQEARQRTAEDLAREIGTIPYEIFTSISRRVPRVYE
jgi:alanine racemase